MDICGHIKSTHLLVNPSIQIQFGSGFTAGVLLWLKLLGSLQLGHFIGDFWRTELLYFIYTSPVPLILWHFLSELVWPRASPLWVIDYKIPIA